MFPDSYVADLISRVPMASDGSGTRLVAQTDSQKQAVAEAATRMPPEAFIAFEPILDLLVRISTA
jgi:hypothetical protein